MNVAIENHIKIVLRALTFQQTQPKEKVTHHNIPGKPWEVIGVAMLTQNNKIYLCIVDYHNKILILKKVENMLADSLILACKIIFFSEFGLPKKIMWDVGWQFHFRFIQAILQKYEHRTSYIFIVASPKQWTGRGMYKILEVYYEKVYQN